MRLFDLGSLAFVAAFAVAGCHQPAPDYPPGQFGPGQGQGNPGQWNPGGQNGGQWQAGAPPPPQIPPGPPVYNDPISNVDMAWLRAAAQGVLNELVAALPPHFNARVQGIPFLTDSSEGEINAFAACDKERMPAMAITDGLLQIEAYIAQMRATDEIFGTRKLDAYLGYLAQNQAAKLTIFTPPAGLIEPMQHADYRKVVRQHHLFEEQVAFVLGHELGHHYLGHTGCANGRSGNRRADWTDIFRKAQQVVPGLNQPNEVAADIAGVNNMLTAGTRRPGYHWTEAGALLTLDFFDRLEKQAREKHTGAGASLAVMMLSSHPEPAKRIPGVHSSAAEWRRTGGVGLQPMAIP